MKDQPAYKRVLIELSGEMMGSQSSPIDVENLTIVARQLAEIRESGTQIAIVIGAGNIWRGAGKQNIMIRRKADMIGMLATIVNAMALQGILENMNIPSCVLSAIEFEPVMEIDRLSQYVGKDAVEHLRKGEIVIFGGGTGNPYFTTDTASALRALQIEADLLIKATKVDGVYTADPEKCPTAKKISNLTSEKALQMGLKVMDAAAFSLCKDNKLPIVVCALNPEGNIKRVIFGEEIGTLLTPS